MSDIGLNAEAAELLAQLVQCNTDAAARTSKQLQDFYQEERNRYAALFLKFYQQVVSATETVTTRQLEAVIDRFAPDAYSANDLLDGGTQ